MSKLYVGNLETWMMWLLFVAKGTSKVITIQNNGFLPGSNFHAVDLSTGTSKTKVKNDIKTFNIMYKPLLMKCLEVVELDLAFFPQRGT